MTNPTADRPTDPQHAAALDQGILITTQWAFGKPVETLKEGLKAASAARAAALIAGDWTAVWTHTGAVRVLSEVVR